jgi:regulatory protein
MQPAPVVMRVAQIRRSVRDPSLVLVSVAGAGSYRLRVEASDGLALHEGLEVDEGLLDRVRAAAAIHEGAAGALRLLQRRLRSRAELRAALKRRGLALPEITAVLSDLELAGWIDDRRFARLWVRDRMTLRPRGARALQAELRARGVSAEIINETLAALISPETEEDAALDVTRRKVERLRRLPPDVARRRLAGWLRRRGFGAGAIARALRLLGDSEPEGANVGTTA